MVFNLSQELTSSETAQNAQQETQPTAIIKATIKSEKDEHPTELPSNNDIVKADEIGEANQSDDKPLSPDNFTVTYNHLFYSILVSKMCLITAKEKKTYKKKKIQLN